MKARITDFTVDMLSRRQRLTLTIEGDFRSEYERLKEKDLEVTLKPFRAKRSTNANSYAWALVGELADELGLPAVEIYRNAIKQVGVYRDVELATEAAGTIEHIWSDHGIGWQTERVDEAEDGVIVRLYYGSSAYNTRQMSRLIDLLVQDCKELGLPTKDETELNKLIEEWSKMNE